MNLQRAHWNSKQRTYEQSCVCICMCVYVCVCRKEWGGWGFNSGGVGGGEEVMVVDVWVSGCVYGDVFHLLDKHNIVLISYGCNF